MKKTVTLNPDESKVVAFEITPTEAGVYNVSVNGLSGSFVASEAPPPPPATGMITLYGENFPIRGTDWNWYAAWWITYDTPVIITTVIDWMGTTVETVVYGEYKVNPDDYYGWRGPNDPCTPPEPIPLNNLSFKINEGSWEYGYASWKSFGPFEVEADKVYTVNWVTGELRVR